jgi:hypothetical protein
VDRFAPARDDDAGPVAGLAGFGFDCGREMHQGGDVAKDSLGMVNQADQFAQIGLTSKIDHPF